jgi:LuxR family maltose regulon positive regulatory protein
VIAYTNRLLDAFRRGVSTPETGEGNQELLSGRELEVLQHMARGLSYQEIGQQLFLSLNTVQSHVKNIYRKLLVNKRMQAIEKAREMHLIYP